MNASARRACELGYKATGGGRPLGGSRAFAPAVPADSLRFRVARC